MNSIYRSFFLRNLVSFMLPMLIPLVILGTLSVIIIQNYVGQIEARDYENAYNQMNSNIGSLGLPKEATFRSDRIAQSAFVSCGRPKQPACAKSSR